MGNKHFSFQQWLHCPVIMMNRRGQERRFDYPPPRPDGDIDCVIKE
jgi:hypothetical protein